MAQHPSKIGNLLTKCNLKGTWQADAPMSGHTTFRVGGPADFLVFPRSFEDVQVVRELARNQGIPLTIVGRGANLLVADQGIRGITLAMSSLVGFQWKQSLLTVSAGTDVSDAARAGLEGGFSCLEFLNAMPSTVGGAIWMNARCYGWEIADVLSSVTVLDESNRTVIVPFAAKDWSYKKSPFQGRDWLILEASFRTSPATREAVEAVMVANEADRTAKGHFRAPCAGSVFKNNHAFGAASGVLIDRCGLKGLRCGKAVVSDWHANIIINEGGALASDIRQLINAVKQKVHSKMGFLLEEEVVYCGDWSLSEVDINKVV